MDQIITHLGDVSLHRDKQQTYFPHLYKSAFRNVRSLSRVLLLKDYICRLLHSEDRICQFLQNIAKTVTSAINQTIQYIHHMCSFLNLLKEGIKSAVTASAQKWIANYF
jgi:hypothetical protein